MFQARLRRCEHALVARPRRPHLASRTVFARPFGRNVGAVLNLRWADGDLAEREFHHPAATGYRCTSCASGNGLAMQHQNTSGDRRTFCCAR